MSVLPRACLCRGYTCSGRHWYLPRKCWSGWYRNSISAIIERKEFYSHVIIYQTLLLATTLSRFICSAFHEQKPVQVTTFWFHRSWWPIQADCFWPFRIIAKCSILRFESDNLQRISSDHWSYAHNLSLSKASPLG